MSATRRALQWLDTCLKSLSWTAEQHEAASADLRAARDELNANPYGNRAPEGETWVQKAKRLAGNYAHVYSFVECNSMPDAQKELFTHLESAPVVPGVSMRVEPDGVWLDFKAPDGHVFGLRPSWLSGTGLVGGTVLTQWSEARKLEATHNAGPIATITPARYQRFNDAMGLTGDEALSSDAELEDFETWQRSRLVLKATPVGGIVKQEPDDFPRGPYKRYVPCEHCGASYGIHKHGCYTLAHMNGTAI